MPQVMETLRTNDTVTSVDLRGNQLNDEGVQV